LSIGHIAPSRKGDERAREWFGRLQVQSQSPHDAVAFMQMAFEIDVREVTPTVNVPTLIIHRTDDAVCHVENARWLARHIAAARYVELPGIDHLPWIDGDEILAEIQEFPTGVREPVEPDRILATVLFTDIVGSTERARELDDRRWRDLVDEHHARAQGDPRRVAHLRRRVTGVVPFFRRRQRQDDRERDEERVAHEEEPRHGLVEVVRQPPVPEREPQLRENERRRE